MFTDFRFLRKKGADMKKRLKHFFGLLCMLTLAVLIGMSNSSTIAHAGRNETMEKSIQKAVKGNQYAIKGGGTIKGSQLIDANGTINEANFDSLSDSAKVSFLEDTLAASDQYVEDGYGDTYTQQAWLDKVQGVAGTEMLTAIMAGQKPNYARARQIYSPFNDPVQTFLGLGAIVVVSLLGVVFVLDICYMALPPFRLIFGDSNDSKASHFISHEAKTAVSVAENDSSADGKIGKVALAIYFKKRAVMLIFLGICLLYLIEGRLYKLVQIVLNLVSGFM